MSREAIEVGAFTWSRIQRLYDADAVTHWQRCESEGLECPQEVFSQLFHGEANNPDFATIVRAVNWAGRLGTRGAALPGNRAQAQFLQLIVDRVDSSGSVCQFRTIRARIADTRGRRQPVGTTPLYPS